MHLTDNEAAIKLAERDNLVGELVEALCQVTQYAESQICMHEETHRGGAIWEICDMCGAKWADDQGGKPSFKWPKQIVSARNLLERVRSQS